jgi:hypothetical protein
MPARRVAVPRGHCGSPSTIPASAVVPLVRLRFPCDPLPHCRGGASGHRIVCVNRCLHALLSAFATVLLPAGCSSVSEISEGLVIAIAAEPPSNPQRDADGSLILNTDLGYRVTLTRAYLVSTSLEIFVCQPLAARLWQRWGIGRAEAHALDAPTRMGTAFVESLTGTGTGTADQRHELGEIKPPPGRYCRAVYTASAADRDAIGMPPDSVAAGNTVYLEGTFQRQPGDQPRPFTAASSAPFTVEADIAAIDLFGATPTPTLVIRKQADHWLDGIDFETHPARVIAKEVLDNVRGSIRLERP